jgi:hypothetical protein
MKKLLGALVVVILASRLFAQSNEPVRLALISESDEASTASDVLTAQLSSNSKIHLLERNEIEKVYREQGLSAANKDYLKLGRILGADGLLLFDVVRTKQSTNLTTRLIAVKPGVVLTDGSFPWPLKDTTSWAESAAIYLNSFLPKLSVLVKDAIPLSVVNLRSAVQSADAQETERQLKLLAIQRLSQERQFFVLERQRMQLLSEEKELKADESAFWNGSYLLEGVVDQNGYSKETVTINARLTPPKGGAPLLFEVSGNRTNLSEVINQLAAKVNEALKVNSTVPEWNAADEAAQYFDEAKWALKWGVYSEAQAAADSAWALGKRNLDCALVRVKSYVSEVLADIGGYEFLEENYTPGGYDADGKPLGPPPSEAEVQSGIKQMLTRHPLGVAYRETQVESKNAKIVQYAFASKPPDPKNIDRAIHALELYYEFSRTSSGGDLIKVASETSKWKNSDWYNFGIEDLVAASLVLQNFNFVPESQKTVADKLAELRALARSVAKLISESPSVHDSYFVGDRVATHDELANTINENPNIFSCKVEWGCFWQETPENCVALYRELMSSPVFSYIHKDLWLRKLQTPRLIAWNEEGRKRVPMVWDGFVQELNASSNVLLQLEAKAVQLADAADEKSMTTSFTNFFNSILENREVLVTNNVEVLYLDWGTGDLVSAKTGNGVASDIKESLQHLFYSEYSPKLGAMDREYWAKTVPAGQFLSAFEKQKRYLKENKPYDFFEFAQTFTVPSYSKDQALEIQPLLAAYKSNLVAKAEGKTGMEKGQIQGAIAQVGFVENQVNRILNPPAPKLRQPAQASKPAPVAQPPVIVMAPTNAPEIVTNVLTINKFLKIPLDRLVDLSNSEKIDPRYSSADVTAHHWFEGKLLLDFHYDVLINIFDKGGKLIGNRQSRGSAIAILDSATEHWDVIDCPEVGLDERNNYYHCTALLHGDLFNCDGGQIRKYDFQNQQWQVLAVSDGNNYELFAVNGHIYAAGRDIVFEILDGGKSTRILASARRNPPVSTLDRENLGTPTLFEGPNHSLRVCTSSKIFTWTGNDWREDSSAPPVSSQPEIFADGVLFRQAGNLNAGYQNGVLFRRENGTYGVLVSQDEISCLANETDVTKLYLKGDRGDWRNFSRPSTKPVQVSTPLWKMPAYLLPNLPTALRQSDLYILEDQFAAHAIINDRHEIVQDSVIAKDEYNGVLLCFSQDFPLPQKLFLKFDAPEGCVPVTGSGPSSRPGFSMMPQAWMFPATNHLLIGGNFMGVWIVPVTQLDSAIAAQKQTQFEQKAKEKTTVEQAQKENEQARKKFLAKYDRNHNGIIDPSEENEASNDPYFIKYKLEQIHARQRQ